MKREFLQNLKVNDQNLPKEVIDAIMEENGRDIQASKLWQEKYNQAVEQHQKELADMTFQGALKEAIGQMKGRNAKAITALLDMDALRSCENQQDTITEALQNLKNDCGYLFDEEQPQPPYARGTGARTGEENKGPATLAGALREKFERK